MSTINPDRLLEDLRSLARFGKFKTGVDRTAFSDEDIAARQWLRGRLQEAGLEADIDRYGNVSGHDPRVSQAVLVGSHTDTVPKGGWLDGALGVIYGLEIARSLGTNGGGGVDVVSFQDEEGSYVPCLGSKSFCGVLDEDEVRRAKLADGRPLSDRINEFKLPTETARLDKKRVSAFFEAHIEQGPRLEEANCPIGVVTGIVGIRRFRITCSGRADHAGTTPLELRQDAGTALIQLAFEILETFRKERRENTVWNIGSIAFLPGAANVVPAESTMVVEFRDMERSLLTILQRKIETLVEARNASGPVKTSIQSLGGGDPVDLDPALGKLISKAARTHGIEPMMLPSGAGHDAMVVAKAVPTAMMFVPSIGGRSHDILENTSDQDIVTGCQVLADAVYARLQG